MNDQRIEFPLLGINKGYAFDMQPSLTAARMNNVRLFDADEGRARGGQRPGLDKWGAGVQVGAAENPVVAICSVTSVT